MSTRTKTLTAKCESCGAAVVWITDQNGTRLPLNKVRVRVYLVGLESPETGHTRRGQYMEEHGGDRGGKAFLAHVSHFYTCPDAVEHSRGRT